MNKREQLKEILEYIPSGAQTLSKNPSQYVIGVTPPALVRGKGAYVWDSEGKKYLDLILGLGPMVFGYANERIDAAVKAQIDRGTIFSLPSEHELALAKVLREVVPCAEMSRFYLNGNDATSGAIRLARHITKRDRVAKCGYHGWQDWSIGPKSGRNAGVPEIVKSLTHEFAYNDTPSLKKILADYPGQIAAVILEPVTTEPPRTDFLEQVKELAHEHGAIFVFDELVTGFRWALGGAQEYFGVTPDLACFGKAISGGYPLSVLSGKKEFMKKMDEVFVSMTFAGYTVGLVAALEAIAMMREFGDVHEHMHMLGQYLMNGGNDIARSLELPIEFVGYGPHPVMKVGGEDLAGRIIKTYIYQEMHKAGILFSSSLMLGYTHTKEQMDQVLAVFRTIAERLRGASPDTVKTWLEGEIIAPRTVRNVQ